MIAKKQLTKALNATIMSFLKNGYKPSTQDILVSLKESVPSPGTPNTQYFPQQNYQKVDVDGYNLFWQTIVDDLETLHDSILDTATSVSQQASSSATTILGTHAKIYELKTALETQAIPTQYLTVLQWPLTLSSQLDLTTSTAIIDYTTGTATLPIDTYSFSVASFEGARITGYPLSGTEQAIIGNTISNILNPVSEEAWMTQVIAGGGGTTYRVDIILPQETKITEVICETTHDQIVSILLKENDSYVQYERPGEYTISGLSIVLGATMGAPIGSSFLYTFGIQRVLLVSKKYINTATLKTSEINIEVDDTPISQITLFAKENKPFGTSIEYGLTLYDGATALDDSEDNPIRIVPNIPYYVANNYQKVETLLQPGNTQDSGWLGTTIQKTAIDGNRNSSLGDLENGIVIGELQWKVDSYEYSWDTDIYRVPGPEDWIKLSQKGVEQSEITTRYVDCSRGWWIRDDTLSTMSGNVIEAVQDSETSADSLVIVGDYSYTEIPLGSYVHLTNIDGTILDAIVSNVASDTTNTTLSLMVDGVTADIDYVLDEVLQYQQFSIVPGEQLFAGLLTRFDTINGNDALAEPGQFFTLLPNTVYKFSTNVTCSTSYTITTPTETLRNDSSFTWYADRVSTLEDITYYPESIATSDDSDLLIAVYLNGTKLRRTNSGVIWQFVEGINTIEVYIYCRQQHSQPLLLGVSLTPVQYPYNGVETDATEDHDYDVAASGDIIKNITKLQGSDKLIPCSLFDLQYNTPILYNGRCTYYSELDNGSTPAWVTNVYLRYIPSARVAARYRALPDDADQPTSAKITATLNTTIKEVSPTLSSIMLVVE